MTESFIMHFRATQDTCVRCQAVFPNVNTAKDFFEVIKVRDDIFFPTISAGMVFFLSFDERAARKLAKDFEENWLNNIASISDLIPDSAETDKS